VSIRDITISVADVTFCLRASLFVEFEIFLNKNVDKKFVFKWLTFVSDDLNVPFVRSSLTARRAISADATVWAQRRLSSCVEDVLAVASVSCIRPLDETSKFWGLNKTDCLPLFVVAVDTDVLVWIVIVEESRLGGGCSKFVFVVVVGRWLVTSLGRKNGFA
jgi:hypothetical protein